MNAMLQNVLNAHNSAPKTYPDCPTRIRRRNATMVSAGRSDLTKPFASANPQLIH